MDIKKTIINNIRRRVAESEFISDDREKLVQSVMGLELIQLDKETMLQEYGKYSLLVLGKNLYYTEDVFNLTEDEITKIYVQQLFSFGFSVSRQSKRYMVTVMLALLGFLDHSIESLEELQEGFNNRKHGGMTQEIIHNLYDKVHDKSCGYDSNIINLSVKDEYYRKSRYLKEVIEGEGIARIVIALPYTYIFVRNCKIEIKYSLRNMRFLYDLEKFETISSSSENKRVVSFLETVSIMEELVESK